MTSKPAFMPRPSRPQLLRKLRLQSQDWLPVTLETVETDLPLESDAPDSFGADDFCTRCRVCTDACPPGAIHALMSPPAGAGEPGAAAPTPPPAPAPARFVELPNARGAGSFSAASRIAATRSFAFTGGSLARSSRGAEASMADARPRRWR